MLPDILGVLGYPNGWRAYIENGCRICLASCAFVSTKATCRTLRNLSSKLYLSPDEKVLPDFGGYIINLLSRDNSKVCFECRKTFPVPYNSEVVGTKKKPERLIIAPAILLDPNDFYLIFAPSFRAWPSHGRNTIAMMMSAISMRFWGLITGVVDVRCNLYFAAVFECWTYPRKEHYYHK